jgi:S-formylglutathione hydrolase FrmB
MAHLNCSFYSPSLKKNAKITVILPTVSADDYLFHDNHPDYYCEGAKYQTLYLLHGSYGDCMDWTLLANVGRYAQEHCVAVVMPSGENSSYVDMLHGEAYLTYISEELPEFLSKIFPLSKKREDTFIAGLSMGGFGTFRAAFEHPERYAAAASLSGALDKTRIQNSQEAHSKKMPLNYRKAVFGENLEACGGKDDLRVVLKKRLDENASLPKLYHTIGTEDFLKDSSEDFINYAKELGVSIEYVTHPGIHDWKFWDTYIQEVLDWLPLANNMV